MFDLVIRNATLYDGTGTPGVVGSLAVQDGRIAAIGEGLGAALSEVDASGLALMPGIIDGHTHYDAQLTWDPFADPSPQVGVTTAVIDNCGFTIAPCREADRDLTMRNLTQVEGMSLDALRAGIRWEFETIPQYLDMLDRSGLGLNVAAFAGHSAIRTYVMGEASHQRAATDDEVARMADIVRDAMAHGAIGFATSTNEPHNGWGGIPMPSRLADDREMKALVRAMGEGGGGLFMLTKGGRTSPSCAMPPSGCTCWATGRETGRLCRSSRRCASSPRSRRRCSASPTAARCASVRRRTFCCSTRPPSGAGATSAASTCPRARAGCDRAAKGWSASG
jgi:N-acyl-D-aspartate/D-glutamate deacylase